MIGKVIYRQFHLISLFSLTILMTGCSAITNRVPQQFTQTPPSTPTISITSNPTDSTVPLVTATSGSDQPGDVSVSSTAAPPPAETALKEGGLYQDNFTDPTTGWPALEFDNSYIGYHEPEYYHVEVQAANSDELVPVPYEAPDDFTAEIQVFTAPDLTEASGDFRYGLAFRRSGNQFYAFLISPTTKEWSVIKNSPTGTEVLREGSDESIQGIGEAETLRVDLKAKDFFFHLNGQPIAQVSDMDYETGEVGFYVQTLDSSQAHIHYDKITIRELEIPAQEGVLYQDNFTDPTTGWPALEFDNSYIGYHEPEYYHVEVQAANSDELVPVPYEAPDDFTAEIQVFTAPDLTEASGDFRYGLAFRRSGNQFYAFLISPTTKEWSVIKNSPTGTEVLREGSDESIQGIGEAETLRVDAQGSDLFFHINDRFVGLVNDPDYTSGEVGFYVQTLDSSQAHIHYDSVIIRELETPQLFCDVTAQALNLRAGPSTSFRILTSIVRGDRFEALGRTTDQFWIRVRLEDSDQMGWVSYSPAFVDCEVPVSELPETEP